MAAREIKTLSLQKVEPNQPWGFRIVGGTDEALILKVDKVCAYSKVWNSSAARLLILGNFPSCTFIPSYTITRVTRVGKKRNL